MADLRRAYRLAYDGRPYHGFQRQPDVPTVEDAIFDALRDLDVLAADAAKPAGYAAAGRTDAGVSARAQTVAFDAPDWLTPRALNGDLPESIRAWASADVPEAFHATHDAVSRTYRYHLFAPTDGRDDGQPFDDERARAALDRLRGAHDFHNLTPDETGTVRGLTSEAAREGEVLVLTLTADGFARQLVRRVVGLVAAVGRGETAVDHLDRVLGHEPLDGPEGVAPAPAEPLVLWDVAYEGIAFTVDDEARERARAAWQSRYSRHTSAAHLARSIRVGLDEDGD